MFTGSRESVLVSYVLPKKEPEFAAADSGIGDGCGVGDDYASNIGTDTHGCHDYGSPQEDLESKVIDVYHHPLKEEPKPELGNDDEDAAVVQGTGDWDPPKEEPELIATSDDNDAGSGRDVGYDCSHCGTTLSTQKFKVEHELRCKDRIQRKEFESQVTEVYHCGYCRCPFVNKELKEQHQRRWCRKRPVVPRNDFNGTYFECDKCEYVTKYKRTLKRHLLMHNKNDAEWFACTQCPFKTVYKNVMAGHMELHDNTFSYCCPICGKSFRKKSPLDDHLLKQHSDEWDEVSKLITNKVYTCNMCDRFRTVGKADFNSHVAITHLKGVGCEKYECPRCPYSTFRKMDLRRHSKMHSKQKDYRCTACKKQFIQKRGLDSHVLYIHADNVDLMKTVTTKTHGCELCSFKTVAIALLKRHVQGHHAKVITPSNFLNF